MKKTLTILLLSLLLFTGCEKRKEEKLEELEKGNETTSTLTTTTSLSTTESTASSTTTSTTTTVTTTSTKKKTTSSTTTKKIYPVTVNGKGYEIGDTITYKVTIASPKELMHGRFSMGVMKKGDKANNFDYLEKDVSVDIKYNVLNAIQGDPDGVITTKGYYGHVYEYQVATQRYFDYDKVSPIDFSKGIQVLVAKVKFKTAGDYKININYKDFVTYTDYENQIYEDVTNYKVKVIDSKS